MKNWLVGWLIRLLSFPCDKNKIHKMSLRLYLCRLSLEARRGWPSLSQRMAIGGVALIEHWSLNACPATQLILGGGVEVNLLARAKNANKNHTIMHRRLHSLYRGH